jgi:hypothetical protein
MTVPILSESSNFFACHLASFLSQHVEEKGENPAYLSIIAKGYYIEQCTLRTRTKGSL